MLKWAVGVLAFCSLASCTAGGSDKPEPGGSGVAVSDQLKVAVIPKGTTHVFWKSVEAGAKKAGSELGVEVVWKGPLTEDDREQQIKVVEDFITAKVDGIALAPLDDVALRGPVQESVSNKIPVVIFDSDLQESGFSSFVATDNKAAGKLGGQRLAELLGGTGKVILLRYQEGSGSTMNREEGFLEAMKENSGIEVLSSNQYGGATVESAQSAAETLLNKYGGEVTGIFCPNESSAFGMLRALQGSKLAGKVKFVGFDSSEPLVKAVEAGEIDALVVQDPVKMGYLAVKTLVDVIKGIKVEPRIDTGARVVDRKNLATDEIQALVNPKF